VNVRQDVYFVNDSSELLIIFFGGDAAMLSRLVGYLWGDLTREEIKKYSILGLTFFFLIGSYWLLRTQKDAVFKSIVGLDYQPTAKMISWGLVIFLVLGYSKLVDLFTKNRLLMILSAFYGLGFLTIAFFLNHPTIGFPNTVASSDRWFGWFVYLFIESFGSIMVGLFWAFVTSSTKAESAKKGFPLIIAGAQTGSILGSLMSANTKYFGNVFLFQLGALGICSIVPAVLLYLWVVPASDRAGTSTTKKPKTGIFEGLFILLSRPYVFGIFVLATIYEVIGTIFDFQMKVLADQVYPTKEAFAAYQGMYGILTNSLALVFAMVGTSFLMRRFGLRFCLMLFPIATGLVVGAIYFWPVLYVVTGALIVIKGLSYALNNPSKEMMYIPTTKDVRFKAKGWIDMFGGRSAKGTGSYINNFFAGNASALLMYGTLISFGLVGVWLAVASFVGYKFKHLTENDEVIS